MFSKNLLGGFIFGVLLQTIYEVQAKPALCGGECSDIGYGSHWGGSFGGGFSHGGYGGGFGGGCIAPTPPISFLPVPQPLPVRVPVPPKQSVTIPNIILALLPPNNKPVVPRPIIRPPPVVLPIPKPYPLPIPSECDGGFGGFGGFGGVGGFGGLGGLGHIGGIGGGCGC